MFKNWNNFCALAALFLTFSLKINAQRIDSARKHLETPALFQPFFKSFPQSPSFFLTKNDPVRVSWGSPFSHWGIMCIGEYKLEKKTGIPFRFRLGSLEYVNKLEGKK
jgi:hypothetical protein